MPQPRACASPFVGPSWAFLHRGHCAPRFIPSGEIQKVVRTGPRVHHHLRVRQARRVRREAYSLRPGRGFYSGMTRVCWMPRRLATGVKRKLCRVRTMVRTFRKVSAQMSAPKKARATGSSGERWLHLPGHIKVFIDLLHLLPLCSKFVHRHRLPSAPVNCL